MAKRVQPEKANLSVGEMPRGLNRIQKRIDELKAFDPETVQDRWGTEARVLQAAIEGTLADTFGQETPDYERYHTLLDNGPLIMGRPSPIHEVRRYLQEGKQRSTALLEQAIRDLQEKIG